MDKEQANLTRSKIRFGQNDVDSLLKLGKPFVLFSGGKDSLCTLEYIKERASIFGKSVTALHVDTTAGFPEVTQYVQDVCKILKVDLIVLKPRENYFSLAKRWGIPSYRARWCCKELKVRPIAKFIKMQEGINIVFDGIRSQESSVRATYVPVWFHPSFRCLSVSPIFKWTLQEVKDYIRNNNLPESPAEKLGNSAECWCGAYKKRKDFEQLWKIHPEIFNKLIEVEEASKTGFTFIYEKGEQMPLAALVRHLMENERLKKDSQNSTQSFATEIS